MLVYVSARMRDRRGVLLGRTASEAVVEEHGVALCYGVLDEVVLLRLEGRVPVAASWADAVGG